MIRRTSAYSKLVLAAMFALNIAAVFAQEPPLVVNSSPVALAELPDGATIGRLRPLGMLQLPSVTINKMRFSQLSGLAWDDDDNILYAISDKGYLFYLRPAFANNKLTGVTVLKAVRLMEPDNKPLKWTRADSEGLEIVRGRNGIKGDAELLVSFERYPRIVRYRPDGKVLGELTLPPDMADRGAYTEPNEMLESVCADPIMGVLTTPERPLRREPPGTTHIVALSGKTWRYPVKGKYGISAMECLGDGRLLILEREFGRLFGRNAISLKIATLPPTASPEEMVAVTEVATLDLADGHQIDNFEGLARHKGNRFFMISDDNDLFVQRTLLLYFEIVEK